jgi:uncharacterized protein YkwD
MNVESLEIREVLSAAPTSMTQYALELVNMVRTNPAAAADWVAKNIDSIDKSTLDYYHINLQQELNDIRNTPAQPPLAWNDAIGAAAQGHSNDQAANNFQGHNGSNGDNLGDRLSNAGYIASNSSEDAFAYATSVDHALKAFLIDWGVADKGHRRNLMQPGVSANNAFKEVGIGITETGTPANTPNHVGPNVVTIDFGSQANAPAQLLGVTYNDNNHNGLYAPGEGVGNVLIQARNVATGELASTVSSPQGGYQMPLAPGTYVVYDVVNGVTQNTQTINFGTTNVKVDFNNIATAPASSVPSYRSAPAPAPAPQPVVVQAPVVVNETVVPQQQPITIAPSIFAQFGRPNHTNNLLTGSVNPQSFVNNWIGFRGNVRIS